MLLLLIIIIILFIFNFITNFLAFPYSPLSSKPHNFYIVSPPLRFISSLSHVLASSSFPFPFPPPPLLFRFLCLLLCFLLIPLFLFLFLVIPFYGVFLFLLISLCSRSFPCMFFTTTVLYRLYSLSPSGFLFVYLFVFLSNFLPCYSCSFCVCVSLPLLHTLCLLQSSILIQLIYINHDSPSLIHLFSHTLDVFLPLQSVHSISFQDYFAPLAPASSVTMGSELNKYLPERGICSYCPFR